MSRLTLPALALIALSAMLYAGTPKSNPFRGEEAPAPLAEPEGDAHFRSGNYREAATWYAGVHAADATILTAKQREAWAFSRIRLAPDLADASALEREVSAAMALAPANAELRRLGESALAVARRAAPATAVAAPAEPTGAVETENFTITFAGDRAFAEKVAATAEAKRTAIFERWSGPAGKAWTPRCVIAIHDTAASYSRDTKQSEDRTGHSTVKIAEGKVLERRLDLRADDEGLLINSLPRELTHVALADLFPYTPPPKWAEEGMAVLAESPEEVSRYSRTLVKCARDGKLFTVAALIEMKDYPAAEKITGFCCGSVSLVEHLVKLKGERHFTTFLRDCQRYGPTSALKRQYGYEAPKALQDEWLKAAIK